jgi:hypothetical protein
MHWAAHVPRPKPGENIQDFRKLNKMAAQSNVTNAYALKQFKQDKDVKLIPPQAVGAQPKVIPSDVIPSFAYGRKSRPSTPINAVVGYQYAAEYEEALVNGYDKYQVIHDQSHSKHKVRLTKASKSLISTSRTKRDSFEPQAPKELFKLTKFKKVPSRLQLPALSQSASMARSPVGEFDMGMSKAQSMPLLT